MGVLTVYINDSVRIAHTKKYSLLLSIKQKGGSCQCPSESDVFYLMTVIDTLQIRCVLIPVL